MKALRMLGAFLCLMLAIYGVGISRASDGDPMVKSNRGRQTEPASDSDQVIGLIASFGGLVGFFFIIRKEI